MESLKAKARSRRKLVDDLHRKSHFGVPEVERLLKMHQKNAGTHGKSDKPKMERQRFADLLYEEFKMTDDVLMDRIFRAFDVDADGYLSDEEWVLGFSTFLKGSLEEKMKYTFKVYDQNADGFISREEMFQFLKNSLVTQQTEEDPDEGIKELVELLLKKMDDDHDSKLSLKDFEQAVQEEPLLLELLGPCLPSRKFTEKFLTLIGCDNRST
ncbi:EF-hand calcium-binding domain-containing protein 1-like [Mizuhopecten yessoensis]|uniref:EF-hand calcium-binding domain-containing protein 1 n=1 Tax=Mizuhopecten yessoensis TaxID=6573 RepID=A0A210QT32_MIZYE|nr:EF-hand calcium-binding domain-containing protein 1-like [Mizuhopecten yessoensis]OWF51891.1 EF-hand calcium-binding domain-containing protein 1 [Mizuhopecten yessoensis]